MNTLVTIPVELTEQQTTLTNTISQIGKQIAELMTQKSDAEIALRRIDTAVRFLRGESVALVKPTPAGSDGKPKRAMSDEAKQKIREAMLRRSGKAAQPTMAAPVPEKHETASVAPAPTASLTAAKKAAKKVGK